MVWWLWMLLGLALLVAEIAAPGSFFALFFGLSGIVVGALTGLGWAGPPWAQWALFSLLSIVALATLRGPMQARLNLGDGHKAVDSLVGEAGIVLEAVAAGGVGKVEVRGSAWSARSAGTEPLAKGQRCRVERLDGLTLWVKAD